MNHPLQASRPRQASSSLQVGEFVDEIEKVLGSTVDDKREKLIGEALACLKNLEEDDAKRLLAEIRRVLKGEVSLQNASEVAQLFHTLKQLAKQQAEEKAIDPLEKAYVEYAKSTSDAFAIIFNAINMFGTTLSFAVADAAKDAKKGEEVARIKNHPEVHALLIAMTLAFLPLSLLTVGMAHAFAHMPMWKKNITFLLMAQVVYMIVMCSLFGVYVMPKSDQVLASTITTCVASVALIIILWWVFRTPTDLAAKCCADGNPPWGTS